MLGGWEAAISGGTSIGNFISQSNANSMNAAEGRANRSFQAHMSNTAHQREVKDLIAAGLNPRLSAGGNGSSSPSGALPTFQAPQIELPNLFEVARLNQDQQRIDIQKDVARAEIGKKLSGTDLDRSKTELNQKGAVRAGVEGMIWKAIKGLIGGDKSNSKLKMKRIQNNPLPGQGQGPASSGAELQWDY